MDAHFARSADGIDLRLGVDEAEVLGGIPDELRDVYESPGGPVRDRLFPRAYLDPTEEDSEEEWQSLVGPDLLAQRLETLLVVRATLDRLEGSGSRRAGTLTEAEADAWLAFLNDARLALAIRLEITEETDLAARATGDPGEAGFLLYGWLTALQGELVEVLLG